MFKNQKTKRRPAGVQTVAIAKAMNQVKVHICERNLKAYLFALVMVFFDPRSKE